MGIHTGHSDATNYTRGPDGVTLDISMPLPGGASYDFTPSAGWVFSHSDLHGDVIATAYLYGAYAWYGVSGPYGESAATSEPDNTAPGGTSRGWHGGDKKITDGPIVHMGARPYSLAHGRFLGVDPVEGGCANNYTYGFGDPVNGSDLTGREWWDPVDWVKAGAHHADKAWDYVVRCGAHRDAHRADGHGPMGEWWHGTDRVVTWFRSASAPPEPPLPPSHLPSG